MHGCLKILVSEDFNGTLCTSLSNGPDYGCVSRLDYQPPVFREVYQFSPPFQFSSENLKVQSFQYIVLSVSQGLHLPYIPCEFLNDLWLIYPLRNFLLCFSYWAQIWILNCNFWFVFTNFHSSIEVWYQICKLGIYLALCSF